MWVLWHIIVVVTLRISHSPQCCKRSPEVANKFGEFLRILLFESRILKNSETKSYELSNYGWKGVNGTRILVGTSRMGSVIRSICQTCGSLTRFWVVMRTLIGVLFPANNTLYWNYIFAMQFLTLPEHCNPWPHVANRHISISQLLSLWRHSHCDVIRYWAGHAQRYGRTLRTLRTYGHLNALNI